MTLPADGGGDAAAQAAAAKAASDAAAAAAAAYVAPGSQEDLDRIINKATAKVHARYPDYETLKTKAARADELEAELGSEADKAAKAARDEERGKVADEYAPRLVRQAFRAEAKGILTQDQLDGLLEDYNAKNYLDDKGDVDEEKVAARIAKLAGKQDDGKGTKTPPRQLGQGAQPPSNVKPGDQGRAMAEKRFSKSK